MKLLITIFFITTILASCKKSTAVDDDYTITGVVLDWDARTPIAGAKTYTIPRFVAIGTQLLLDSGITDALGKVVFTYKKADPRILYKAEKTGYILPFNIIHAIHSSTEDITDTTYLVRPSYVNVTVHKAGIYLPGDSVDIKAKGHYNPDNLTGYLTVIRDKADSPDKILNLPAFYFSPYYTKMYFQWDIIRNGSILSSGSDSTDMIQFATKNYSLNY